jgi:hypothetical protein
MVVRVGVLSIKSTFQQKVDLMDDFSGHGGAGEPINAAIR